MVKSEEKIRLEMMTTADQVRRIKLKQLKKRYRYATGGSGRRFLLAFALRKLRSHGKGGISKKASVKRVAVWTVTSTSQATDSSPVDDYVEEEDISEVQVEESLEQEEWKNDEVEDASSDQILLSASFTANEAQTFPSGSQNLLQDDSRTAALPSVQCPLEPTQFFNSLQSKGLQILEDIEVHISTTTSNCNHLPLKDLVFGEPLNGTTPLLLACHYGDLDWVKRIVKIWGVDVNEAAVYFFDPHHYGHSVRLERATPLFIAAKIGHVGMARFLVGEGADVSFETSGDGAVYDGFTPLYAVARLFYGDRADSATMIRFLLESGADPNCYPPWMIIPGSPLWMMESVDAITSLIDHGLDFDQRNADDETAMHHWVNLESKSSDPNRRRDAFTVIKQLVEMGASLMDQDENGFNVILAAVHNENWTTVDYLLEKDGVDRIVKIEAMELAGAIILSYNDLEFERAFNYWRQALRLRQLEPALIKRIPFALKSGQAGEWITSDELEHVIEHPTEYQIQSFLVRLRICSNKSWGAVLDFLNEAFEDCLGDLNAQGRLADVIDVLWATWSAISDFDSDAEDLFWKADDIVTNFITVLSQLRIDQSPLLNGETLMLPLEIMIAADEFITYDKNDPDDSDDSYNIKADGYMDTYIKLVTFLAGLPFETLTPQIRESLRHLVLADILFELKQTLLHTACCYCGNEDLPIIRLLLLSGADPNAFGGNGNAPLHILANANQYGNGAVIQSAAHLLFGFGAQLERTNDDGETPADVWIRCHEMEADEFNLPEWLRKPVNVPDLKDLCARVVRSQDVPYDGLPATLIALVEMRELGG